MFSYAKVCYPRYYDKLKVYENCNWTLVPNNIIKNDHNIEALLLAGNNFTSISFEPFAKNNQLQRLNLSSNNIQFIESIQHPEKFQLKELWLSNNDLVNISELCKFEKLEILTLGGNKNLDFESVKFNCWSKLKELDLSDTNLRRLDHNYSLFAGLNNLKYLNIQNNNLEILCIGNFPVLAELQVLNVDGNNLTTLDTDELKRKFPKIGEIRLASDSFGCAIFKKINETLIQLGIQLPKFLRDIKKCNKKIPAVPTQYTCDIPKKKTTVKSTESDLKHTTVESDLKHTTELTFEITTENDSDFFYKPGNLFLIVYNCTLFLADGFLTFYLMSIFRFY